MYRVEDYLEEQHQMDAVRDCVDSQELHPAKTIEVTEQEIKDLKKIREYFGQHDETLIEHMAYAVIDRLIEKATQ